MKENTGSAYAISLLSDAIDNINSMITKSAIDSPEALLHLSHTLTDLEDALTVIPYGDSPLPQAVINRIVETRRESLNGETTTPEKEIKHTKVEVPEVTVPPVHKIEEPKYQSYETPTFESREKETKSSNEEYEVIKEISDNFDIFDYGVGDDFDYETTIEEEQDYLINKELQKEHQEAKRDKPKKHEYHNDLEYEDSNNVPSDDFPMNTIDFTNEESSASEQPDIKEDESWNVNDYFTEEELDQLDYLYGISDEDLEDFNHETEIADQQESRKLDFANDAAIIDGIFED